jgi:hypothetical protein
MRVGYDTDEMSGRHRPGPLGRRWCLALGGPSQKGY